MNPCCSFVEPGRRTPRGRLFDSSSGAEVEQTPAGRASRPLDRFPRFLDRTTYLFGRGCSSRHLPCRDRRSGAGQRLPKSLWLPGRHRLRRCRDLRPPRSPEGEGGRIPERFPPMWSLRPARAQPIDIPDARRAPSIQAPNRRPFRVGISPPHPCGRRPAPACRTITQPLQLPQAHPKTRGQRPPLSRQSDSGSGLERQTRQHLGAEEKRGGQEWVA